MESRNIIVTGGAGFVGSHLIGKLLATYPDVRVTSIDNYFTGRRENHLDDDRVLYREGDTRQIAALWQGEQRPDAVFHLGEYSRIVQSFQDIDDVWEFNMRGTKEVVRFCHQHQAKLIYGGSSSKFGNQGRDQHLSPYAWIKAKNIEYITNYDTWFGLDYVITYFFNVYGPGHIKRGPYATLIGIFEAQYEEGVPLTVVSPGTQTRDFTHIEDIVAGILLCFEKGQGDGYLLGTGREHHIVDVARMFGCEYTFSPERPGERKSSKANIEKMKALGWTPQHSLEEYIAQWTAANKRPC